jgi:Putative zinc-finger
MEHTYVEEHNIADCYLLGKLSAEERIRFEEHFENCMQCSKQLEAIDGLRTGLRIVAGEEVWRPRALVKAGALAWAAQLSRARQAALLVSAILLIALPMGLLILEWSRSRRDLAQTKLIVAEWRRKYEEREQAARDLMKEMQGRDQQLSAQRDRFATQSAGKREHRSRPANGMEKAAAHQAVVPVFALRAMRSDDPDLPRPAHQITLPSSLKQIVLLLELGPDTDFQSYRVAISAANGRSIWRESQLTPTSKDTLALGLNSRLFKSSDYLLTLEGLTTQARYVLIARHTFRVITR